MNLHLSYVPYLNCAPLIAAATPPLLDLADLDLRISLAVSLFPLVLLAAFHLKDDHLVAAAVAEDLCLDRALADLGIAARAEHESGDLDISPFFLADAGHANSLARFDRELLAARFNDCVTHF